MHVSPIQPATPGEGQEWDTSDLYTEGILRVVGGEANPNPDPQVSPNGEQMGGSWCANCASWCYTCLCVNCLFNLCCNCN